MAEFVAYLGLEAVLDDGTVIDKDNSTTLYGIVGISRGVGNLEEAGFADMSGPTPTDRRAFMVVKMVDGSGVMEWENGNADTLTTQLSPGMCFVLPGAKSFDKSTTAGDATVTRTALDVDTALSGRGARFEYYVLTGAAPAPLPTPCGYVGAIAIDVLNASTAPSVIAVSSSGYYSVYQNGSIVATIDGLTFQYNFSSAGPACVYPSDQDGNPSGLFTAFATDELSGLGVEAFADIDLSPLDASAPMATDPDLGFALSFLANSGWTTLTLPDLQGQNGALQVSGLVDLEDVIIPSGVLFSSITLDQCPNLTEASVDALCNALDPSVTGENSDISSDNGPAPTAASLANRNAYIANGNTLNVFTP